MASLAINRSSWQRPYAQNPERRSASARQMKKLAPLSAQDVIYCVSMAVASVVSYWIMTYALSGLVDSASDYLGGMWATVATVFVFRDTRTGSRSAGFQRFMATCVSFILCQIYFLIFPFESVGMAALLCIGTLILMTLGWREDIVTTGITTAVVMVVAAIDPRSGWLQPPLRLLDTVVGIAVGIGFKSTASFFFPDPWKGRESDAPLSRTEEWRFWSTRERCPRSKATDGQTANSASTADQLKRQSKDHQ
jgi:uncharacterized membrane protein YccC